MRALGTDHERHPKSNIFNSCSNFSGFGGFCLVVKFHWGESATNGATLSMYTARPHLLLTKNWIKLAQVCFVHWGQEASQVHTWPDGFTTR